VADADGLEHAFSVNAVAGVLEKLGRDDEAISTMARAKACRRPARGGGAQEPRRPEEPHRAQTASGKGGG